MFKAQGKIDQWLATLEEYLKQPVQDLSHVQLRVEVANHLMDLRKYKEAEPYAAKAAETFAAWAIVCAIDCYEGLEDWEKAELWVRRLSERYPPQCFDWALRCKRTGKGDWEAARELADEHVKQSAGRLSRTEAVYVGVLQLLSAKPDQAAETFGQLHRSGRSDAQSMLYAFACDQAGMKEQRDEVWKNYPNKQGPFAQLGDDVSRRSRQGRSGHRRGREGRHADERLPQGGSLLFRRPLPRNSRQGQGGNRVLPAPRRRTLRIAGISYAGLRAAPRLGVRPVPREPKPK